MVQDTALPQSHTYWSSGAISYDSRQPPSPAPSSPKSPKSFSRRLSIFGSSSSKSQPKARPSSLLISAPTSNSSLTNSPGSPAISFRSAVASTSSARDSTYTPSISSIASSRPSRAPSMVSPTMPSAPPTPKLVRRKAVPKYEDDSLATGITSDDREWSPERAERSSSSRHRRQPSAGTEGMWQSGRDSIQCREVVSPTEMEKEEDGVDGLWSSSLHSPSVSRHDWMGASYYSPPPPSMPAFRSASPALSSTSFRRGHSRASSSLSFNSSAGVHISPSPTLQSPRTSIRSSFQLPKLEMPRMPTLFPCSAGVEPYNYVAEPTPLARDYNPFESARTYSRSSSSSSSDGSSSTAPTDDEGQTTSAIKRRASVRSASTVASTNSRPSLFRVESGGKSLYIQTGSESGAASRSSVCSAATKEEASRVESDVLEIRLVR